MKAIDIMNELFQFGADADYENTCDTLKAGDPNKEVQKVAVCMFATPDVIRQAHLWGAQLVITHEPTYYNHMDNHSNEKLECEKRKMIEDTGMTIYRYHDHPHFNNKDQIAAGELRDLALEGTLEETDTFDLIRVHLNHSTTPRQLASLIETRLGIAHVRICGAADVPMETVSCMFGAPGGVLQELQKEDTQILLVGETCEWMMGEYVRDAAQMGYKKALLILGHVGSERAGMVYIADVLQEMLPELEVKYFECGEVYTYSSC